MMLGATIALGLALAQYGPNPSDPPPVLREARAVWVASVANIDWPNSRTLTVQQQKDRALAILDKAVELNLNMVILQVRPACDALYASTIEPWSEYLTNVMGTPPSPLYDPLTFWIEEAHKRGLELHAWFNPYRALSSSHRNAIASNHVSVTHPEWVKDYGSDKWLDPGLYEVREYSLSVVMDVVNRYDVDGIHFDDYFYPYPISGTPFPDDDSYAAYQASGGTMTRANWRRWNVDTFVSTVYQAIKASKPRVKFGISPFGIWRPGNPPGITGLDAYASLYADSRKWLNLGWVDYFTPQLYWQLASTGQSYTKLLDWWIGENLQGRHLWPGNFTSNIGSQFGDWPAIEIVGQIYETRRRSGATGNVHFSARAFTGNYKDIVTILKSGMYVDQALVPASPWLDRRPPGAPLLATTAFDDVLRLSLDDGGAEAAFLWIVSARYGREWRTRVVPAVQRTHDVPRSLDGAPLAEVRVSAVDRTGNESEPARWPDRSRWGSGTLSDRSRT